MRIGEEPKQEGGRPTVRYNGKKSGPDDLAVAFMFNVLAKQTFIFYQRDFMHPRNPFNHLERVHTITDPTDLDRKIARETYQ